MTSILAVTTFGSAGVVFLLWCLVNFMHEDRRHRRRNVKVTAFDPAKVHGSADVVSITAAGSFPRRRRKAKIALLVLLAIIIPARAIPAQGVDAPASDKKEIEELRQMVRELRDRVAVLEAHSSRKQVQREIVLRHRA